MGFILTFLVECGTHSNIKLCNSKSSCSGTPLDFVYFEMPKIETMFLYRVFKLDTLRVGI